MIVERLNKSRYDGSFDLYFYLLTEYKKKHGNCDVPQNYEMLGCRLGTFVNYQRNAYRNRKLKITQERVDKLNSIGFDWKSKCEIRNERSEKKWKSYVNYLKRYKKKYGDLLVPYNYQSGGGFKLGQLVMALRNSYNGYGNYKLTEERIKELDELGFIWDAQKYRKENNIK